MITVILLTMFAFIGYSMEYKSDYSHINGIVIGSNVIDHSDYSLTSSLDCDLSFIAMYEYDVGSIEPVLSTKAANKKRHYKKSGTEVIRYGSSIINYKTKNINNKNHLPLIRDGDK